MTVDRLILNEITADRFGGLTDSHVVLPSDDFVVTEGVKRWITDVEKCYTVSRLREQYCHICVDVCPFVHKSNGDETRKAQYKQYKQYMAQRKKYGYRTPAWWPEEPPEPKGI